MKKRMALLSFLILLSLASCELPYRPIYPIDAENAVYNYKDYSSPYECSTVQGEIPSGVGLAANSPLSLLSSGLVLVSSSGKVGAYSLISKSIVVPALYDEIQAIPSQFNGAYCKAIQELPNDDYSFDVFDPLGYPVLSGGHGDDTQGDDFSLATFQMEDDYHQVIDVEAVDYSGILSYYQVKADRSRVPYYPKAYFSFHGLADPLPCRSSLSTIGLADYELSISRQKTLFLWKDGRLVTDFQYPTGLDVQCAFWKSFFGQRCEETASAKYDFESGGKRFALTTERLEIINGEYFPVSFPYYLEKITPLYDDEGVAHYALAEVKAIKDHSLTNETSRFVIDNAGHVRADVTDNPRYDFDISKISPAFFFNQSKAIVYNTDFEVVASSSNPVVGLNPVEEQMVVENNGHYGVLGFDGASLLAPIYDSLTILPQIEWHALGKRNGKFYLLNPAGKEEKELTYPKNYSEAIDTQCGYVEVSLPITNDENLSWVGHAYVSYNGDYDYRYINNEQIGKETVTLFGLKAYCSLFHDLEAADRYYSLAYVVKSPTL
jgi:hypothetical protein